MFLSVFDIFKIGIGPSSSHTMGPMVAAGRFLATLRALSGVTATRVDCRLHGSLAFTGKGHATDRAVILGLSGLLAEDLKPGQADRTLAEVATSKQLRPPNLPPLAFDADHDVIFDFGPALPAHSNGMVFSAYRDSGEPCLRKTYFSVGGGFVLTEQEFTSGDAPLPINRDVPYPFESASQMLAMGESAGLTIAEMKRANEESRSPGIEIDTRLDTIWSVMSDCIDRGLAIDGELPGGLRMRRRAHSMYSQILAQQARGDSNCILGNDWLAAYAMAVNEENAAGGQVVTSPTNGAAGVFPAVVRFYIEQMGGAAPEQVREMLLIGAAIGGLIKHNASISGAEVGCQGEVGSAAAMAAAALCAVQGGSNRQVENAAEIALEHHLGMTCDPIRGLVQAPCIERNAFGAIKAVAAASLAMHGDGRHLVPLDACIETMRQTGEDMSDKYKETALGGLAVNLPQC